MPCNKFELRVLLLSLKWDKLRLFLFCGWYLLLCESQQQSRDSQSSKARCTQKKKKSSNFHRIHIEVNSAVGSGRESKARICYSCCRWRCELWRRFARLSASEQSRREQGKLMPKHELFLNAATCTEPEGHRLQLAQLQVRHRVALTSTKVPDRKRGLGVNLFKMRSWPGISRERVSELCGNCLSLCVVAILQHSGRLLHLFCASGRHKPCFSFEQGQGVRC